MLRKKKEKPKKREYITISTVKYIIELQNLKTEGGYSYGNYRC